MLSSLASGTASVRRGHTSGGIGASCLRTRTQECEYEEEKKKKRGGGLTRRRVDFLMEKTRFGGLSRGRSLMPGEWVLHVE